MAKLKRLEPEISEDHFHRKREKPKVSCVAWGISDQKLLDKYGPPRSKRGVSFLALIERHPRAHIRELV